MQSSVWCFNSIREEIYKSYNDSNAQNTMKPSQVDKIDINEKPEKPDNNLIISDKKCKNGIMLCILRKPK